MTRSPEETKTADDRAEDRGRPSSCAANELPLLSVLGPSY